jgi:hypothetical protein
MEKSTLACGHPTIHRQQKVFHMLIVMIRHDPQSFAKAAVPRAKSLRRVITPGVLPHSLASPIGARPGREERLVK